jgi:hypothetical protein
MMEARLVAVVLDPQLPVDAPVLLRRERGVGPLLILPPERVFVFFLTPPPANAADGDEGRTGSALFVAPSLLR